MKIASQSIDYTLVIGFLKLKLKWSIYLVICIGVERWYNLPR